MVMQWIANANYLNKEYPDRLIEAIAQSLLLLQD